MFNFLLWGSNWWFKYKIIIIIFHIYLNIKRLNIITEIIIMHILKGNTYKIYRYLIVFYIILQHV